MRHFSAAQYGNAMSTLGRFASIATAHRMGGIPFEDEFRQTMHEQLREEVAGALKDLPLSRPVRDMLGRLAERVLEDDCSLEEACILLREVHNAIVVDMTTPRFLLVSAERRHLYDQRVPSFGEKVADALPLADKDIAAASRCLALDEWTACVFHLMRVLEIGLHDLAERLELPSGDLELENWKNIIDRIEKAIRGLEQLPRSHEKSEKVRFYAETANGFRTFKDAWRNHVSHSRITYDERDALVIYNSTQVFMQVLARGLSEGTGSDA